MLVTHWIAGTDCTSWSDRASLAPETGRKRHLQRIKKAKQGRRETRTRVKPSTRVFCPTPIAPKTQNPRPHPRRPGTGPTSAPTSARDPLNTLFRSVRTYSPPSVVMFYVNFSKRNFWARAQPLLVLPVPPSCIVLCNFASFRLLPLGCARRIGGFETDMWR
jgi:hypothetical protein